ncbi:MAG: saccharopine dehydrogenase C-terminal domain-containing protein [Thermoplasmata archaeon]
MITVLGFGKIGKNIVSDLSKYGTKTKVIVYDPIAIKSSEQRGNIKFINADPLSIENRDKVFSRDSIIISALPAEMRATVYRLAKDKHSKLVDIAFGNDDISDYLDDDSDRDYTIVPDAGVAPGISNILVGRFAAELDQVTDVKIYVGGIPEIPVEPLDYKLTFSSESLVDEYVNTARIVESGKIVEKEPLSGIEYFDFEGINHKLEAFYTDGLRTLLKTIKANNMSEKTVRYAGHSQKVKLLRDLGLFDSEERVLNNIKIKPRNLMEKLFDEKLIFPAIGDILLLTVNVSGMKNGAVKNLSARLLYSVKANKEYTAMSMTTGCPASIIAQLLEEGYLNIHGLVPPELIGKEKRYFDAIIKRLEDRGIKIKISD